MKFGERYYVKNLQSKGVTNARAMLLEVMANASDKRMKKSELSKEILKAMKVNKAEGYKTVSEKDIANLITQLCNFDPNNKAFYVLK